MSDPEPVRRVDSDAGEATRAVESAGLEVLAESRLGKAVAGPAAASEALTGGEACCP